jgi:hypothetical protein
MKRMKISRKKSKRSFKKGTRVHNKNIQGTSGIMRGGIRL